MPILPIRKPRVFLYGEELSQLPEALAAWASAGPGPGLGRWPACALASPGENPALRNQDGRGPYHLELPPGSLRPPPPSYLHLAPRAAGLSPTPTPSQTSGVPRAASVTAVVVTAQRLGQRGHCRRSASSSRTPVRGGPSAVVSCLGSLAPALAPYGDLIFKRPRT